MSPAYFLFLLQLNSKFENEVTLNIFTVDIDAYSLLLVAIVVTVILAILLKFVLLRQLELGRGNTLTLDEMKGFTEENIDEHNGSIISFLLGTVIPAVLIIETSVKEAVFVFFLIQIIMFILITRSSEIFPNLTLTIMGIDICKMKNGNYLLLMKQREEPSERVIQIGDPSKSKLFITSIMK